MTTKSYKWGIIGCGKIASKFAESITIVPDATLHAVASRTLSKAQAFGDTHGAAICYGSYEELVQDKALDAVYIATPHVFHKDNTLMTLAAGIPTLCEKPMAMNEKQVASMVKAARENKVFLMEAIWTRFIPAMQFLMQLIDDGTIGELKMVRADFGFNAPFDDTKRIYNRDLGGGALLDVGIYPIFLSKLLLGNPQSILASAVMASTGVDESCAMVFKYDDNNQMAILDASIGVSTAIEAWIYGTKGKIHIHNRFHQPKKITLYDVDRNLINDFDVPYIGNGYAYEIEEVQRCLAAGKTESDLLPLSFSLELIKIMDEVREICGIVYPKHDL